VRQPGVKAAGARGIKDGSGDSQTAIPRLNTLMHLPLKVLFVCTQNIARSPMAATIFRELIGAASPHVVRAMGIASSATQRLTTRDVAWADVIVVMEPAHLVLIKRRWRHHAAKVWVLDVPDDYDPGEPELRAMLTPKIRTLLEALGVMELMEPRR
jgi:predicted protein tyrosine phosphatase